MLESGPLRQLLPAAIHVAETVQDQPVPEDANPFAATEAAALHGAVELRRAEFLTTRWCAHRALAAAGAPPLPLLRGADGEPVWPGGFVGSLTHVSSRPGGRVRYRAAAVADAARWMALGIDAEQWAPLPDDVADMVCTPAERDATRELLPPASGHAANRLVFSIKESFYKARFPLTRMWLDFLDAEVRFDGPCAVRPATGDPAGNDGTPGRGEVSGRFSVVVANDARRHRALPDLLDGRFLLRDSLVVTAVMLER